MLDLSLRYHRGGAAPRNWHRDGELLHRDDPDNHLEEKAAAKTDKDLPDKDLECSNTH